MTTTSVRIGLDLGVGETIKIGSTPTISDVLSQCDLTDLVTGIGEDRIWATFENDQWLLDGSRKILPDSAHVGVISGTISGVSGIFATPPELTITLGGTFTLIGGITLEFSEANGIYANDVDIVYKNSGGSTIASESYIPNSYKFFCELSSTPLENIKTIVITFNSTNVAYRHLRLTDISYDIIEFEGGEIKEATIVEEISPLGIEIPSNSLEFTVHSDSADFSIVNPQGLYKNLKQKQKIDVYSIIDGVSTYMGRFYLDDWESLSVNTARFTAYDAISLLETVTFYTPGISSMGGNPHTYAYQMVDAIMDLAGVEYSLDASLSGNIRIWNVYSGMLPIMSCREALQHICFVIGAYVDCSESEVVKILPFDVITSADTINHALTNSDIASPVVSRRPDVTALEIVAFDWSKKNYPAANLLFTGTLTPGRYFMTNQSPSYLFVENAASTIMINPEDAGPWWIDFIVTTEDTYELTDGGFNFEERKDKFIIANDTVPSSTPPNEINIHNAYLIKGDGKPAGTLTVTEAIQRIFQYYLQRFQQKARLFGVNIHAGESASVTLNGSTIYGMIESAEIDLAGGLVSNITIVGDTDRVAQSVKYNNTSTKFTYSGFASTNSDARHYEGDIRYSASGQGGFIEFYIIGYQFKFIYRQLAGGLEGSVTITIDGVVIDTIDQNGTTVYQQEWLSPVMENTYHKVRIDKSGTTGTANIDAVEVLYK